MKDIPKTMHAVLLTDHGGLEKLEYLDRENLIKHFVSAEFNRYLSYYKNSRDINVANQHDNKNHDKSVNAFQIDKKLLYPL